MADKTYTITELNKLVKLVIDSEDAFSEIYVKGEISNYKKYPSGHHYFTLKDAKSQLKCVMFKGSAANGLRFRPENGMSVIAFGNISVYARDGLYQLYVNGMTPDGVGDLYIAFEQLKEKLRAEGLFEESHKKPLPRFPVSVTVITSGAGAAVEDIKRILRNRWPMAEVVIMPVRVQGPEAPPEIKAAIEEANRIGQTDIIITGRGGGTIEDLWAFNDECVARAIYNSKIPVISAVGHEPDVTIADFVADIRAATPSNAAEIAVPDAAEIRENLRGLDIRLRQNINGKLRTLRDRLRDTSGRRVLASHTAYIDDKRLYIDRNSERLIAAMQRKVLQGREKYAALAAALDAMSPLKVLGRGYSIAQRGDGSVIKTSADVKIGDHIKVILQKDEINCIVE